MRLGATSGLQRQVTLRDVAERAGVHVSTASRALNDRAQRRLSQATIERVKRVAAELRYEPDLVATGLRRGRTMTVGVLTSDLGNPYHVPLVRGLSSRLERDGYVTLLAETIESRERAERLLRHLVQRRVDAIVNAAARHGDVEMLTAALRDSVPMVLAVRDLPTARFPAVTHDDRGGGAIAARHLLDLGHTALAQLLGPADIDPFVRRADGFAREALGAGATDLSVAERGWELSVGEGERLTRMTLDAGSPSAIFAPSDMMAIGAIRVLGERGLRCPEDVSVVGYNDLEIGEYLTPPLTSVRLPSEELGSAAAELAIELIEGRSPDRGVRVPAELVVRATTAPPARA